MRALYLSLAALISAATFAKPVVYDGEFYEHTKGSAPSSLPYVHPSNVVDIATKEIDWSIYGPRLDIKDENVAAYLTQRNIFFRSGTDLFDVNCPIEIGKYAVAAIDTNTIYNIEGSDYPKLIYNTGIAIGCCAIAEGVQWGDPATSGFTVKVNNQNIAIGQAAKAKGVGVMAIGPGYTKSTTLDGCIAPYAEGHTGMAIGSGAKGYGTGFTAIGSGPFMETIASNNYTVAIGPSAKTFEPYGISLGYNALSTNNSAIAIGNGSKSSGGYSTAIGAGAYATGQTSVSIGVSTDASANNTVSIGYGSQATTVNAISIGYTAKSRNSSSVSVGINSDASGSSSIAIGDSPKATSQNSIAVGHSASATGANSTSIGNNANTSGSYALSLGWGAESSNYGSVALGGFWCKALSDYATAIGTYATASGNNSVALGYYSSASKVNSISVGFSNVSSGESSLSIGVGSHAANTSAIAIGNTANALATNSVSIGTYSKCNSAQSVAIGYMSEADALVEYKEGGHLGATAVGGYGAKATHHGATAVGVQANATGENATALGAISVASSTNSIAVGCNAVSHGASSIAIGISSMADKDSSIAIGDEAKAYAPGAAQLGKGVNNTANSLQFQDVTIVKNGKLVGASVTPTELNVPLNDSSIKLEPGSITTFFPDYKMHDETEVVVESPNIGDLRNYEIYLPNEPNVRAGLPIRFKLDRLPENITKVIIDKKWQIHKLPAKVTITQPYSKLVICKIEEIDDGTAWTPVITSAHIKWDGTKFITDGSKLLEGTNLQSGVSLKIKYPILTGNVISYAIYDITGDSGFNDQGILNNTFYEYVGAFEFTPPSDAIPTVTSGSILPITLIYKTKNSVYEVEYTVNYDTLLP